MHRFSAFEHMILESHGSLEATLQFCVADIVQAMKQAVHTHGFFTIALSGGSTPHKIYQQLVLYSKNHALPWDKTYLFWSDERAVAPTSSENNFYHSMHEGSLSKLPIPSDHIYRMKAEEDLQAHAEEYEHTLRTILNNHPLDFVMLGMGEDGHTASLFPDTQALKEKKRWVVANYVSKLQTFRMTMTYPCINQAAHIRIYVFGASKAIALQQVLLNNQLYPVTQVGSVKNPALWIVDDAAAQRLFKV